MDLGWLWCVGIHSSLWVMLIMGEIMHMEEEGIMGEVMHMEEEGILEVSIPSSKFCCQSKMFLKKTYNIYHVKQ